MQIAFGVCAILHDGGTANHFELADLGEIIEDLILHSVRKVGVIFARTNVIEGKDGNAFLGYYRFDRSPN